MNDAAAVGVVQRARGFVDEFDYIVDAQQIIGTAIRGQRTRAMDVLGHDVAMPVLFSGIVDRQDIGMLQHPHHVRFRQKHLARDALAIFITAGVDVVHLDGHVASVVRIVR